MRLRIGHVYPITPRLEIFNEGTCDHLVDGVADVIKSINQIK